MLAKFSEYCVLGGKYNYPRCVHFTLYCEYLELDKISKRIDSNFFVACYPLDMPILLPQDLVWGSNRKMW